MITYFASTQATKMGRNACAESSGNCLLYTTVLAVNETNRKFGPNFLAEKNTFDTIAMTSFMQKVSDKAGRRAA
jgi:hypothetical protein